MIYLFQISDIDEEINKNETDTFNKVIKIKLNIFKSANSFKYI